MIIPPDEIADYVRFDVLAGYTLDDDVPDDVQTFFADWLASIDES